MRKSKLCFLLGMCVAMIMALTTAMVRYPVGQSVPVEVYTAPFEPDGIYRFMQTSFDPNNPKKLQSAPDDWIAKFGNNERTLLFHTVSELRILVANQNKQIVELEKWKESCLKNEVPENCVEN